MFNKLSLITLILFFIFVTTTHIYCQELYLNSTDNQNITTSSETSSAQEESIGANDYGKTLIAVLDFNFENVMPLYAGLFSDFVRTEFSKQGSELYAVMDKDKISDVTKNVSLQNADVTTSEYAVKIGELSGAKGVIFGTISYFSAKYYTKATLVDVATGETIRSETLEFNDYAQLHQNAKDLVTMLLGSEPENRPTAKITPLKTYKTKKLAIGIGNPYLSLYYELSNKLSIEPRIASDFDEIRFYAARVYYTLGGKRFIWYLAFEPGYIDFKASPGRKNGYMVGFYPGVEYLINDSFSINIDIGPSYIDLDSAKASGFEWILNTGIRFYP